LPLGESLISAAGAGFGWGSPGQEIGSGAEFSARISGGPMERNQTVSVI